MFSNKYKIYCIQPITKHKRQKKIQLKAKPFNRVKKACLP